MHAVIENSALVACTCRLGDEEMFAFADDRMKNLDVGNPVDGTYSLDVIGTGTGDFGIDIYNTDQTGKLTTQFFSGHTTPGAISRFTFNGGSSLPFAAFSTKDVHINLHSGAFKLDGSFTLGTGASIDPLTQAVIIQVGGVSTAIPPGRFTPNKRDKFEFKATIDGIALEVTLGPHGRGYTFEIEGAGAHNLPKSNPATVRSHHRRQYRHNLDKGPLLVILVRSRPPSSRTELHTQSQSWKERCKTAKGHE